jgi:5-methylthioribose kinase
MREITAETAADYLRETHRVASDSTIHARELGGGVSNVVLRVDADGQPPLVLKQSRERLRTQAEWVSRLDRIWIEQSAIELLARLVPAGTVPSILFADPENYLFAMTCAPDDSVVWKTQLLAGETRADVARQAGTILGMIHRHTSGHPALAAQFADTSVFDDLRIDPFYRRVAQVHPDIEPDLLHLIASGPAVADKTFVHADFSPKNILVHQRGMMLVDFETAHAGDPAFDLGFFLSHLLLKAFRAQAGAGAYFDLSRTFWDAYRTHTGADLARMARAVRHAAACMLARIDGKSPVDYRSHLDVQAVRRFARAAIRNPPPDWEAMLELAAQELRILD